MPSGSQSSTGRFVQRACSPAPDNVLPRSRAGPSAPTWRSGVGVARDFLQTGSGAPSTKTSIQTRGLAIAEWLHSLALAHDGQKSGPSLAAGDAEPLCRCSAQGPRRPTAPAEEIVAKREIRPTGADSEAHAGVRGALQENASGHHRASVIRANLRLLRCRVPPAMVREVVETAFAPGRTRGSPSASALET